MPTHPTTLHLLKHQLDGFFLPCASPEKVKVTIPAEIREKAGLLPDTEVDFVMRGCTVVLGKAEQPGQHGKPLVSLMRGKGTSA